MTTHCQSAKLVMGAICHCTHPEASAKHGTKPAVAHCLTRCQYRQPGDSQLDAALRAQARGEVYAPPGRCKGCGR